MLYPPQSPVPGFGDNILALSGLPSQSFASGGGSRFTVMFGQTRAYLVLMSSHFSRPGSVSGLIASTGHSGVVRANSKYLERPSNRSDRPGEMQENQWPQNPALTFWQSKPICSDNAHKWAHIRKYASACRAAEERTPLFGARAKAMEVNASLPCRAISIPGAVAGSDGVVTG